MPALAFGTTLTSHHQHAGFISLDYLFILINGIAVFYATRNHKSVLVRSILWGALALFSVSLIFEAKHSVFTWLGYAGSVALIIGHLLNLYICQIAPRMRFKVS
jgi:RsiW-degrading membrane proteinase PrsW (M82 family)